MLLSNLSCVFFLFCKCQAPVRWRSNSELYSRRTSAYGVGVCVSMSVGPIVPVVLVTPSTSSRFGYTQRRGWVTFSSEVRRWGASSEHECSFFGHSVSSFECLKKEHMQYALNALPPVYLGSGTWCHPHIGVYPNPLEAIGATSATGTISPTRIAARTSAP